MLTSMRFGLPIVLVLAGLGISATQKQSASPSTPQVVGQNGGPPWHHRQDIGNGVELEAVVQFCQNVTDPATGATVRPISMHMNFLYGAGVMQQLDYLQLHALSDAASLEFEFAGIDRNVVVAQPAPFEPLHYLVTVTPKTGYAWGTIRGAVDLDIHAVQR